MTNQITINQMVDKLNISKKAIILIANMEATLTTQEDRQEFLKRTQGVNFENGYDAQMGNKILYEMRRDKLKQNQMTFDELVKAYSVDPIKALSEFLIENINPGHLFRFKAAGERLDKLFELKQVKQDVQLMDALLYM